MALTEQQALAGLRVLVCVAKADGVLHDEERRSLSTAIEGVSLPDGLTLDGLLDEKNELDDLAKLLQSDEARVETFKSAYGMAHADGNCSSEEQALLDRLQKSLEVADDETSRIKQLFAGAADGGATAVHAKPIEDPAERESKVQSETTKTAIFAAVLGAFPVPGLAIATDLAVVGLQVSLVRDIGAMWNRQIDKKEARSLLVPLGVGTGAQIAASNLIKFLPGWGSAFGATTSFAWTFAIGRAMNAHFARGARADMDALANDFKEAKAEGKKVYAEKKEDIQRTSRASEAQLKDLATSLKKGEIAQDEYERRVSALPLS
jgi:uncharacterized protein (DUF697 family)/tellurite resistance protein